MKHRLRLFLVNTICKLWPIMPRRLRLWAFLHDDMPDSEEIEGIEEENESVLKILQNEEKI